MIQGNASRDLRSWREMLDPAWLAGITTVTTNLAESSRAGLYRHLGHAARVADPFHVVRVGNRCLDNVRRRVQIETLQHRDRKNEPLYRIRKLLLTGAERLDEHGHDRTAARAKGRHPNDEVLGAWLPKESVREICLTKDPAEAVLLLNKVIAGCVQDDVPRIASLGRTLANWSTGILAHHRTRASNGHTNKRST